jgi:microcystin degradation protein MlrC
MRGFVDRIKAIEDEDPDILSISVIHGFMAGDVPEMGTKIIVVSDNKSDKAAALAQSLGEELFAMRGTFMAPQSSPKEAISLALSLIDSIDNAAPSKSASGPVVIADVWDNPGGGTAGDATILLAQIMEKNITNVAFGSIWDPIAVQICIAAGVGAEIPLRFGAKSAPGTGQPIDSRVRVEKIVLDAEIFFGQSLVPIGNAVHISFDGIDVVLNTTRAQCFDRSMFDIMGINPEEKDILIIKSTNHFYQSFEKIAHEIIYCSAGSPYPNDPCKTNYLKAPKNIWPIIDNPFENKEV